MALGRGLRLVFTCICFPHFQNLGQGRPWLPFPYLYTRGKFGLWEILMILPQAGGGILRLLDADIGWQ